MWNFSPQQNKAIVIKENGCPIKDSHFTKNNLLFRVPRQSTRCGGIPEQQHHHRITGFF